MCVCVCACVCVCTTHSADLELVGGADVFVHMEECMYVYIYIYIDIIDSRGGGRLRYPNAYIYIYRTGEPHAVSFLGFHWWRILLEDPTELYQCEVD